MSKFSSFSGRPFLALLASAVLVVSACGSDTGDAESADGGTTAAPAQAVDNACPVEGCVLSISDVQASGEDALAVTFAANFAPDFTKNHIHLYWDTFEPGEVSSDADANGLDQGDWTPTGDYPTFITESATLISNRGESTTLCVTAANRDHAILDAALEQCFDVADLVG